MIHKHTNDEDNEVGGLLDKVPSFITAIIAVGGLIAAYFMTVGDFRIKDMELQQRMSYIEQKVERIEQSVVTINGKLDSRIPLMDTDRQSLRKEIDDLKDVLQQMKPYLKK